MKLVIPEIPPSNNKYIGRDQRWAYQAEKQRWHWLIVAALPGRPAVPMERAKVQITYYFPTRGRRDPDNYAGKMLLDPLVRLGVLADDSFGHIELVLVGRYDKDNPRTEIVVEEYTE